jgi:prepilin-type N-terminal cleavage/methylation domain-containing protein
MRSTSKAFTIVELLVVVVVIGILATISIVAYTGIRQSATEVVLQSDLKQASTHLEIERLYSGSYPAYDTQGTGIPKSDATTYEYTTNGTTYCLSAKTTGAIGLAFHIDSAIGAIEDDVCEGHTPPGGDDDEEDEGGGGSIQ